MNINKYNILEEKKKALLEERKKLWEKIEEITTFTSECDMLEKEYGIDCERGSYFGRMRNLVDFEEKWHDTVFWKYHNDLDEYSFIPLDYIEKRDYYFSNIEKTEMQQYAFNILAYCEFAIHAAEGFVLHLIDPFANYDLLVKGVDSTIIQRCLDRIVFINCLSDSLEGMPKVIAMRPLLYSLIEKL